MSTLSHSVYVDPLKVGTRRNKTSYAATLDNLGADRVEHTEHQTSYITTRYDPEYNLHPQATPSRTPLNTNPSSSNINPPPSNTNPAPSAPLNGDPLLNDIPPRSPQLHRGYCKIICIPICILVLLVLLVLCFDMFTSSILPSTVEKTRVTSVYVIFTGTLEVFEYMEEEAWELPNNAALIRVEKAFHHNNYVVVGQICNDHVENYEEISHYTQTCEQQITRYEEWETYSHTEETCSSNGICE